MSNHRFRQLGGQINLMPHVEHVSSIVPPRDDATNAYVKCVPLSHRQFLPHPLLLKFEP
jgi:hypothetical protein